MWSINYEIHSKLIYLIILYTIHDDFYSSLNKKKMPMRTLLWYFLIFIQTYHLYNCLFNNWETLDFISLNQTTPDLNIYFYDTHSNFLLLVLAMNKSAVNLSFVSLYIVICISLNCLFQHLDFVLIFLK